MFLSELIGRRATFEISLPLFLSFPLQRNTYRQMETVVLHVALVDAVHGERLVVKRIFRAAQHTRLHPMLIARQNTQLDVRIQITLAVRRVH